MALHQNIYDLGIAMQRAWQVFNIKWNYLAFSQNLLNSPVVFIFSPIGLTRNYQLLLIVQSFFLGASAFPIYGIASHTISSKKASLLISLTYLLYFPLSGLNLIAFHYQMFFVFFFITGYYFFLKNKFLISLAFFLISGMSRYPYEIFPLMFSLVIIFEDKLVNRNNKKMIPTWYISVLLFSNLLIIILGYIIIGKGYVTSQVHINTSYNLINELTNNFQNKLITFFLIFGPLLFIPLISKRWLLFFIPGIYEVFISSSNWTYFVYPAFFKSQYISGFLPFLFLGLIDGINLLIKLSKANKKLNMKYAKDKFVVKKRQNNVVFFVILSTIIFATIFEPYSPLNDMTGIQFHETQMTNVNLSVYNSAVNISNLIPGNVNLSNILVQANLPMILPRPINETAPSIGPLIPGTTPFNQNNTLNNIIYNSFPIELSNGEYYNDSITYVVADPLNSFYSFGTPSMYTFVNLMLKSGKYGILAEESGIILLERGYTGKPLIFQSYILNIQHQVQIGNEASVGNSSIEKPYAFSMPEYIGPIVPGNYSIEIKILSKNYNSSGNVTFYIPLSNGYSTSKTLRESNFQSILNTNNVFLSVCTNLSNNNIPMIISGKWYGCLTIESILVNQISPIG